MTRLPPWARVALLFLLASLLLAASRSLHAVAALPEATRRAWYGAAYLGMRVAGVVVAVWAWLRSGMRGGKMAGSGVTKIGLRHRRSEHFPHEGAGCIIGSGERTQPAHAPLPVDVVGAAHELETGREEGPDTAVDGDERARAVRVGHPPTLLRSLSPRTITEACALILLGSAIVDVAVTWGRLADVWEPAAWRALAWRSSAATWLSVGLVMGWWAWVRRER